MTRMAKFVRWAPSPIVLAIALTGAAPAHASVEYCRPYARLDQTGVDLNAPFLPYTLTVETNGGRRSLTLIGDTVLLNKAVVGSLIKTASEADASIASIKIDARTVIVQDSLAFSGAAGTISAEQVTFREGGFISMLPTPSSRIAIFAKSLSIETADSHIFDVRPRSTSADKPDDFGDISNILSINVREFSVNGNAVAASDVKQVLADQFTMQPIFDFMPKIDVSTGDIGQSKWITDTRTNDKWPEYSVRVWRSALVTAPFDPKTRDSLAALTKRYSELITAVGDPVSLDQINALKLALARGTDLNGYGPAWATTKT